MRWPTAGERGAGSVLAVALVAAMAAMVTLLAPLEGVVLARQRAAAAADASALAAADVLAGFAPGIPCDVAARVATANGARLGRCAVAGTTVTVTAVTTSGVIRVTAEATAGPPSQ